MRLDHGDHRSLRHVVPVGLQLPVAADYQLFLLALYLWDDRFDIAYAKNIRTEGRDVATLRRPDWYEDWEVSDDLGREYSPSRGGGGGGSLQLRRTSFVPPVASDARALTLSFFDAGARLATHSVDLPDDPGGGTDDAR